MFVYLFVKVLCRSFDRNGTHSRQPEAARLRKQILQAKVSLFLICSLREMYISFIVGTKLRWNRVSDLC